ncbi:MAG: phospho-N-acetylmuramoyl-pentapeptide-transferase [Candidatus Berkelbacteria bacterium]|nr:phospho-N-acetylmuramoyl-pentapeptide-transferase [Candidatus Berkelbacteria bacterium]
MIKTFSFDVSQIFQVFVFLTFAFLLTVLITPIFTDFLYRNRIGKKIRTADYEGNKTPIFSKLHQSKENTPTMGGVLIWGITAIVTLFTNFSRGGTLLPLFTLFCSGVIGAIDDLMNVFGIGMDRGGMRFRTKLLFYSIIATAGSLWFAFKLDWLIRPLFIPGLGNIILGYWYIPVFILVLIFGGFAANQTYGLDGLAGGIFAISFGAYIIISLSQGNVPLAIFCATITGAILAFLWFNVYPARFFMGDTGAMSLGMTLGVIAFLTNTVYVLPFVGFIMVIEALSTIIQIASKKFFHKKVFLVAPIHHHFEAKGWPETKVTMRFWIITAVSTTIGLALVLINS